MQNPVSSAVSSVPVVGGGLESGDVSVIEVRNLSFWYDSVIGLSDLSVDIKTGVIGLLGPNGSGKSTLMKLLTGQLLPQAGTVTLLGENVRHSSKIFQSIGFVPEQDAFYEDMTGLQFVTYLTELQGFQKGDAETLAAAALARLQMTSKQDIKISKYSKGMRQRTKIAQAIAHQPQLLFLDEPLTGTDPVGRQVIIDLIRDLGASGCTVIVSSHILHEVEQMTRSIMLIHHGKMIASGDVSEIRSLITTRPQTIQVMVDRPRDFGSHLVSCDDIQSLEFFDNCLKIRTNSPQACFARIPQIALEHDFNLHAYQSLDNNLQAIFDYLVVER